MNLRSWLSRGTLILMLYGGLVTLWIARFVARVDPGAAVEAGLVIVTCIAAALAAVYTAWLFHQARGRVLWMRPTLTFELLAHAVTAGSALLVLLAGPLELEPASVGVLRIVLVGSLVTQLGLGLLCEGRFAPTGRVEEYRRAHRLVTHGPYARRHWRIGIGAGVVLPLLILTLSSAQPVWAVAATLALVGIYVEQDILVRAGQVLPIS